MKSIKQQYIDLREGNMTQANFMRNLRMTLPQYVTNVTSFEDSVRILKNKGILTEADTSSEGKWKKVTGKDLYDHFKEIDNLNGQEVLVGIDYEMIKNPELTKLEAEKIVIKNLKKNPIYYTSEDMSGVEGYEPEYMSKLSKPEDWQMKPLDKNMGNVVDKKMGMQPVKGIEKPKKDSDKGGETNKTEKGISLMSLIAKTSRGVQKMDATGEKMKKISMKEVRLNDFPGATPGNIAQQIMNYVDSNPTLKQYSDEITLQSDPDGFLKYGYWESLPADALKALSLQFDIKADSDYDEDTGTLNFYRLTPKYSVAKVDLGNQDLMKLRETIREIAENMDGMEPMVRTGLDEGKVMDFNEWLNQIASSYPNLIGQDLQNLGVDINTITPEELQDIVTSQGELINDQRGIYKFGKTLSVEPGFISSNRGLESYGYYVVREKEGNITNPKTDWSARIYPPGSRMD